MSYSVLVGAAVVAGVLMILIVGIGLGALSAMMQRRSLRAADDNRSAVRASLDMQGQSLQRSQALLQEHVRLVQLTEQSVKNQEEMLRLFRQLLEQRGG